MADISERVYRELVLKTLDAALDENCWPELLRSLARACGGLGSLLAGCSLTEPGRGLLISGGLDVDLGQLFVERYQDNPWTRATIGMRPGDGAIDIASRVDRRSIRATEFHADVVAPQGIDTMTGMSLPLGSAFDTCGISIAFTGRDEAAPRRAIQLLNLLAPYLQRAVQLNLKMRHVQQHACSLEAALHAVPCAALLVAPSGRVLFANQRAEALLATGDGLRVSDRELVACAAADTRALRRLIGQAGQAALGGLRNGPDALAVARPSGLPALSVLVAPVGDLRAQLPLDEPPAALLMVTDPQDSAAAALPALQRLGALYGLTPMEAHVAVQVALGLSGPEAAAALGIGPGTVHAHLKSVFAKTGVRRQSGLARLLTRSGVLDLR